MEIEYDEESGVFRVIDVLYLNDKELITFLKEKSRRKKLVKLKDIDIDSSV